MNSDNCQKKHNVDVISHDLFVEHFEKLGNIPEEELLHTFDNETDIFLHGDLENDISADEVSKCIKKLKNEKSCGYDGILNEFLKTSSSTLLISVTVLFNIVLQTGKIPHAWSIGSGCICQWCFHRPCGLKLRGPPGVSAWCYSLCPLQPSYF